MSTSRQLSEAMCCWWRSCMGGFTWHCWSRRIQASIDRCIFSQAMILMHSPGQCETNIYVKVKASCWFIQSQCANPSKKWHLCTRIFCESKIGTAFRLFWSVTSAIWSSRDKLPWAVSAPAICSTQNLTIPLPQTDANMRERSGAIFMKRPQSCGLMSTKLFAIWSAQLGETTAQSAAFHYMIGLWSKADDYRVCYRDSADLRPSTWTTVAMIHSAAVRVVW